MRHIIQDVIVVKGSRSPSSNNSILNFFMKKFRKDREGWETIRKDLYSRCMNPDSDIPEFQRQLIYDYRDGLYETPKVYDKDGYAYNDGSWKKFKTGWCQNGVYRKMTICGNKDDLLKKMYAYICFLRKMGIDDMVVIRYFVVVYMLDRLDFKDGMFPANLVNCDKMGSYINTVLEKDIDDVCCDCDDERRYAISPDLLKKMDQGNKVKIQRKKDKEINWKKIEEFYDDAKTNAQNLIEFRKNGLKISERTLQRWKKSRG